MSLYDLVSPEEPCDTAEELLTKLAPQHPDWKSEPDNWIYRGQGNDWPLLAKAHREPSCFDGFGVDPNPGLEETVRQARNRAETTLINRFLRELDEAGIEIPAEDTHSDGFIIMIRDYPAMSIPLLALAQHWRIPTGLLDWSKQAPKAAYFAAADAVRRLDGGRMVVWALRKDALKQRISDEDFTVVTAPQWSNHNLRAQSGLFTHLRIDEIVAVDQYMPRIATVHPYIKAPRPWMRKLSAPCACAPKVLRLLAASGITAASMFPGHAGAVEAMKEKVLWDVR